MVRKDLSRNRRKRDDAIEKVKDLENQLGSISSLKDALDKDLKSVRDDLGKERILGGEYKKRAEVLDGKLSEFKSNKLQLKLEGEKKVKDEALEMVEELRSKLNSEKTIKESIDAQLKSVLPSMDTLKKEKNEMSAVVKELKKEKEVFEEKKMKMKFAEEEKTEALEKIQELKNELENTIRVKTEIEDELQQVKDTMENISSELTRTSYRAHKSIEIPEE
jgi:chromosome segregation ATPase